VGRNVYQASSALADTDVVVVVAAFVVELSVVAVVDEVEVLEWSQQQPDGTNFHSQLFFHVAQHWLHPLSDEVPQQTVSWTTRTQHLESYRL
jgi:hypothetical protein